MTNETPLPWKSSEATAYYNFQNDLSLKIISDLAFGSLGVKKSLKGHFTKKNHPLHSLKYPPQQVSLVGTLSSSIVQ